MAYLPALDRYDYGLFAASIVLLFFAYVVYPLHIVKITTWFVVFILYLTWMTLLLYKWMFDIEM